MTKEVCETILGRVVDSIRNYFFTKFDEDFSLRTQIVVP